MTIPAVRADRATESAARARAGRIRQGIHNYLGTLADIAAAYAERDWVVLDYQDWQSYVDAEYGADRLRLSPEHRQKAVAELRLAGMSQRAIGSTLGVDHKTVGGDLRSVGENSPTDSVIGTDGKSYSASAHSAQPTPPTPSASPDPALEGTVLGPPPAPRWTADEEALRGRLDLGQTVVVSLRGAHANLIGWAETNGLYVRVDRRTEWGNPFELPDDGDRTTVIANYRDHYLPHKPSLLGRLPELRGRVLGCWCAPEACHGDVLAEAAMRC